MSSKKKSVEIITESAEVTTTDGNSLLIKLWSKLTASEKKKVGQIISSPVLSERSREETKVLYTKMLNSDNVKETLKYLSGKYQGKLYDLRSYLIDAIEELLLIQYLKKHKKLKKILIQNAYAEKEIPNVKKSRFPISEDLIEAFQESEDLFYAIAPASQDQQQDRSEDVCSEIEKIRRFDAVVIKNKIKHSIFFESQKTVINDKNTDNRLTNTIEEFVDDMKVNNDPLLTEWLKDDTINMYYACRKIQTPQNAQCEEEIDIIKKSLKSNRLNDSDRKLFFTSVKNFYIRKWSESDSEENKRFFFSNLLDFFKAYFKPGDGVSQFDYVNFVDAACFLHTTASFDQAEKFIEENIELLEVNPTERKYYYNYCKAMILFERGEQEKDKEEEKKYKKEAEVLAREVVANYKFKDQITDSKFRMIYLKILYENKKQENMLKTRQCLLFVIFMEILRCLMKRRIHLKILAILLEDLLKLTTTSHIREAI